MNNVTAITICTALCTIMSYSILSKEIKRNAMKLNAGIITPKLEATKDFYVKQLGFGVTFENDFYLLLHTPDHSAELAFLLPDHPTQATPKFQKAYSGQGMYLTIEVEDVDALYKEMIDKKMAIEVPLKDEAWGDRHFAIVDPNGIGIDFVKYTAPADN